MSDPALDIVHQAVQALQLRGDTARASASTLARLAATAGTKPAAPAPKPVEIRRPAPVEIPKPAPESPRTEPTYAPLPARPSGAGKAAQLAALSGPVLACAKCPNLVASRTQVVFGVGNPDAEIMFVGEAPGADEDMVGEPFVGKAGQLLTKIIETMGLRRADTYRATVVKCRPLEKPTPGEVATCTPYLVQQVKIIQPRVIVALGGAAVEALLGEVAPRGQWREFQGIPVMPTLLLDDLIRDPDPYAKRPLWEDMLAILERLGKPITEKQRGFFLAK